MLPSDSTAGGNVREEWYSPEWLTSAPYAPVFEVRDTENKYGRCAKQTKKVTIKDLIKFHGHFCSGLVESASSFRVALAMLFPDGIVDRTELRIVSNNSACRGDMAAYLTGARARFNSHEERNCSPGSSAKPETISLGLGYSSEDQTLNLPESWMKPGSMHRYIYPQNSDTRAVREQASS